MKKDLQEYSNFEVHDEEGNLVHTSELYEQIDPYWKNIHETLEESGDPIPPIKIIVVPDVATRGWGATVGAMPRLDKKTDKGYPMQKFIMISDTWYNKMDEDDEKSYSLEDRIKDRDAEIANMAGKLAHEIGHIKTTSGVWNNQIVEGVPGESALNHMIWAELEADEWVFRKTGRPISLRRVNNISELVSEKNGLSFEYSKNLVINALNEMDVDIDWMSGKRNI